MMQRSVGTSLLSLFCWPKAQKSMLRKRYQELRPSMRQHLLDMRMWQPYYWKRVQTRIFAVKRALAHCTSLSKTAMWGSRIESASTAGRTSANRFRAICQQIAAELEVSALRAEQRKKGTPY